MVIILTALSAIGPSELPAQSQLTNQPPPLVSWWHRSFDVLSWRETLAVVKSPRAICWQVRRHVTYHEENGDQWSRGQTIWNRGYGDCDDFATCVEELCEAKGFTCWIALVFPVESHSNGHCVVMGIWNGQMWMASNGKYYEVSSLAEALKKLEGIRGFEGHRLEFVPFSLL